MRVGETEWQQGPRIGDPAFIALFEFTGDPGDLLADKDLKQVVKAHGISASKHHYRCWLYANGCGGGQKVNKLRHWSGLRVRAEAAAPPPAGAAAGAGAGAARAGPDYFVDGNGQGSGFPSNVTHKSY